MAASFGRIVAGSASITIVIEPFGLTWATAPAAVAGATAAPGSRPGWPLGSLPGWPLEPRPAWPAAVAAGAPARPAHRPRPGCW